MPCWTFRNSSRQKSLSQKVFAWLNLGMPKITREHWQQVSFIVSSSVLHGDYTGVMSTVCYAGSTCGVNAEAPHAAGGFPGAWKLESGKEMRLVAAAPRGVDVWEHSFRVLAEEIGLCPRAIAS